MKKHLSTILLLLMFIIGLSVMLYPTISDYWNSRTQSRAIANLEKQAAAMKGEDFTPIFEKADAYNAALLEQKFPLIDYQKLDGYMDILDISGTGIMGYISIDKINVELPIYHGTSAEVLNVAVGHLEGSSFPVGGLGSHAVLSAHRGLPSAKLFTNLDKLVVGDTFTITILDRVMTYQVDQVLIVEPEDVDALKIEEDQDYCTLITCTPYGVNSHRLLVRGTRVENAIVKSPIFVPNDCYRIDPIIVTPVVATPMLLILLIILLVKYRKKK